MRPWTRGVISVSAVSAFLPPDLAAGETPSPTPPTITPKAADNLLDLIDDLPPEEEDFVVVPLTRSDEVSLQLVWLRTGVGPVAAVTTFSPAFDGEDRVLVDEP